MAVTGWRGRSGGLSQPIENANAGNQVQMTSGIWLTDLASSRDLVLQIDRGQIGRTQVVRYNYTGSEPLEVRVFEWDQVKSHPNNSYQITIPTELPIDAALE